PLSTKLVLALPTTWPAVAEAKVTLNWPLASVVPVSGVLGTATAPFVSVNVDGKGGVAGGGERVRRWRPRGGSRASSAGARGARLMRASSNVLMGGPLWLETRSPVARVSVTPLSTKLVLALPRTWPALAEVKVTLKWPAASVVPVSGVLGTATAPFVSVN